MKGKKIAAQKSKSEKQTAVIAPGKFGDGFTLAILFVISFLYFLIIGKHIFSYQDSQILFVYSGDYLQQYLCKPGGVLEYAGNFLAQVYFNPVLGSLLLSSIFLMIALVSLRIIKVIYTNGPFLLPFAVLPSCILIFLQSDFNYPIQNNLGFLLILICFLVVITLKKRSHIIISLALYPLLYYIAGGYSWILVGMYITFSLAHKNFIYPLVLISAAALVFFGYKELIFLQPFNALAYYPLPQLSLYKVPVFLYLVYGLLILYPGILFLFKSVRVNTENIKSLSFYLVMTLFALTIFILSRKYNPDITQLFKLEKLVYEEDWNAVVKYQEDIRSKNIVAQYYYNLALSETDQLCDRLFFGPQDYGPQSLMVQWDAKANINQIFRGAYFFYNIGLINEAHRWAFESMVMQGYRPENIKMLIKTELINGNYRIAEKYIYVLKRTLRYKKLAMKFEAMLKNPGLIKSDPDMGKRLKLRSGDDFLIRLKDQQANVLLLLKSNPGNTKAFEYVVAWYLLERNVGNAVGEVTKLKDLGYTRIPRHIEEAYLVFVANTGTVPDSSNIVISSETKLKFKQFQSALLNSDNITSANNSGLKNSLDKTFWYYLGYK